MWGRPLFPNLMPPVKRMIVATVVDECARARARGMHCTSTARTIARELGDARRGPPPFVGYPSPCSNRSPSACHSLYVHLYASAVLSVPWYPRRSSPPVVSRVCSPTAPSPRTTQQTTAASRQLPLKILLCSCARAHARPHRQLYARGCVSR